MNEAGLHDIGLVGLGVMGGNLARNFARNGLRVLGHQRDAKQARALAAAHPEAQLGVAETIAQLVQGLARPRRIVLLVPAGNPVDAVLASLDPLLESDDVVVDAGNSLYTDTDRRNARAEVRPWRFVGMGVSGGAEGALNGPSLMPGGDQEAWEVLRAPLERIAARSAHGPCVAYCGRGSAGHFVKMVHNGIEYGDMQLIAETAVLLRAGLGFDAARAADVFATWNAGELESFLIELTGKVLRVEDPERPGRALVDAILDAAGQKGTGRWTAVAALELGVAIPTIAAAVDARVLSAQKAQRVRAETAFGRPAPAVSGLSVDDMRDALYASKLASYAQGFEMLRVASKDLDYGIERAEIARIWTAGCIIRARVLEDIMQALRAEPEAEQLLLTPRFVADLAARVSAWRRVVSAATSAGIAVPGLAASLSWFDTLTTAHGSAGLIQAQRDAFGSHTYQRLDRLGEAVHTEWGV